MAGESRSRRGFLMAALRGGAAVTAAVPAADTLKAQALGIRRFDHVALPMQNTEAMVAFYRALGFRVDESSQFCTAHFGDNMINFHRPALWQSGNFTLRAPAAKPPCGDLCFVWEDTAEALHALLAKTGAKIEVGPVNRQGGREGGKFTGSSVYVRDPDGNLLEFMKYA
jgi:catechol 2,3-dioxygenase-like lactoylglutathione lyase family enzyme